FRDDSVLGSQTRSAINDEKHKVGFVDCLSRLPRHLVQYAFRHGWLETTGIHYQIRFIPQSAVAIMTVSRQPGNIRNNGVAATRHPIEKARFADIGPPYQYEGGFHGFSLFCDELNSSARKEKVGVRVFCSE